jgi:hypothetical protein
MCSLYPPGGPVYVGSTGEKVCVRVPLNTEKLRRDLQSVLASGITSIAVVLKHSALWSDHEQAVGVIAREMGFKQVRGSNMPRDQQHRLSVTSYHTSLRTFMWKSDVPILPCYTCDSLLLPEYSH